MNENNDVTMDTAGEQNEQPQEPAVNEAEATAESPEQQIAAVDAPQADAPAAVAVMPRPESQKPKSHLAAITAVLVCAVVAAGLFAAKTVFAPKPELVVKQAFAATMADQEAAAKEIYQKIPATEKLFKVEPSKPSKNDFEITLKSVEDMPYAALASAVIADSGIRGSVLCDPAEGSMLLDMDIHLKDNMLADAKLYASADVVAGGVPSFSDKLLSVSPKSFANDYKNSFFYGVSPLDDQTLEMIQQLLVGEIDYMKSLNNLSYEKLVEDITGVFAKALDNAAYSYDKNTKSYIVTIPGEDAKAAIVNYYRYLYLDSEIASALEGLMAPMLSAAGEGSDYQSAMNEMISEIEANIPPMDTVINLTIDKKLIKKASIVATPVVAEGSEAIFTQPMTMDIVINGKNCDVSFALDIVDAQTQLAMNMDVTASGKYENDVYTIDMNFVFGSDETTMEMPIIMSIAADGSYNAKASVSAGAAGQKADFGFEVNGTVVCENDNVAIDLPASKISYAITGSNMDSKGALVFDYSQNSAPLNEKISVPENCLPLFSLTEEQFGKIADDYSVGAQGLVGKLLSALAG